MGSRKQAAAAVVAEGKKLQKAGQKRAEALIALIVRRKGRIIEDFYDIGEALRELMRKKLYASVGYASFEALLTARKLLGRTQAYKLITLVERVPRETALALGMEKAYSLVSYTVATPEPDVAAQLVKDDAVIDGKPVSKLSAREIDAAASKVRARKDRARRTATEREQDRRERALIAGLRARLRALGVASAAVEVTGREVLIRIPRGAAERLAG
jgi:hypothetical protein